jgi:hypothetical protein
MVQSLTTNISSSFKLLASKDTTYSNRIADFLQDLSIATEVAEVAEFFESAQVTDQAIDFGNVTSPTFIYIRFTSQADGNGSNADGTHEAITVKINSSTAITTDTVLLQTSDPTNDTLPTTITWSSVADSTTKVQVFIAGRA